MPININVRNQNEFSDTGLIFGKNRSMEICRIGKIDDAIKNLQSSKNLRGDI